jgi:hypothetical protein
VQPIVALRCGVLPACLPACYQLSATVLQLCVPQPVCRDKDNARTAAYIAMRFVALFYMTFLLNTRLLPKRNDRVFTDG